MAFHKIPVGSFFMACGGQCNWLRYKLSETEYLSIHQRSGGKEVYVAVEPACNANLPWGYDVVQVKIDLV